MFCAIQLVALPVLIAPSTIRAAPSSPISGRYVVTGGGPSQPGGTVDIDPRRPAYTVNCRLDSGKTLRGLGLADGADLIGASLYTGGIAHGLAIYRRDPDGRLWRGRWITSIDSASSVGVMDFEADPKQPTLAGKHHFSGHRVSTGQFDGTVALYPKDSDFLLTFTTSGGATLYKGVGTLRGDRLVVAWSFGSSPALAVYESSNPGELSGRRISLRARGTLEPVSERLFSADASLVATGNGLINKDARGKGGGNEGLSASEPGAPPVKTTSYNDLMSRYGTAGWAERWLGCQLTADEQRLLQLAVVRRRSTDPAAQTLGSRTVSQLIEEQRGLLAK